MKNTAEYYENAALDAVLEMAKADPEGSYHSELKVMAQTYSQLAQAAAVAEQTRVLENCTSADGFIYVRSEPK